MIELIGHLRVVVSYALAHGNFINEFTPGFWLGRRTKSPCPGTAHSPITAGGGRKWEEKEKGKSHYIQILSGDPCSIMQLIISPITHSQWDGEPAWSHHPKLCVQYLINYSLNEEGSEIISHSLTN